MINGAQICLVNVCSFCGGSGHLLVQTAAEQLNNTFGGGSVRAPCPHCSRGICFRTVSEADLLHALLAEVLGNADLQRYFREVMVRVTERGVSGSA